MTAGHASAPLLAAEARWYLDSETGQVCRAEIAVFDVERLPAHQ
jgi:hypothetical protein